MIENYNHSKYIADNARKEKFNIEGNRWYINVDGSVTLGNGINLDITNHSNYFKTKEIAKKVAEEQRLTNFIANMAYTLDEGKWEANWDDNGQDKYYILYCHKENDWYTYKNSYRQMASTVYMSEDTARLVVEELNRIAPDGELR